MRDRGHRRPMRRSEALDGLMVAWSIARSLGVHTMQPFHPVLRLAWCGGSAPCAAGDAGRVGQDATGRVAVLGVAGADAALCIAHADVYGATRYCSGTKTNAFPDGKAFEG